MVNFWSFFIKKANFSTLLIGVLILAGLASIIAIPKESAPEVRVPIAVVTTVLPGAPAEDVERLITIPVEDQLNAGLDDVDSISSTSSEGVSSVVIEFNASADIDKSIQAVKDEVDKVTDLPEDATEPNVTEIDLVDQPVVQFSLSSDLPFTELIELAEDVEQEIKRVSGVSDVNMSGLRRKEVNVIVDKSALQTFGLDIGQVIGGIARANSSLPVGGITTDGIEYAVKFEGDITSPGDIANLPITNIGGVPVYVRDVAFVSDTVGAATSFSRVGIDQGEVSQAVSFAIFKQGGGDVTRVTRDVLNTVERLQETILADAEVLVTFDSGQDVRDDLQQLSLTGLQTVMLVVLVLLITLGWREAVIAGFGIPMSFLLAFIGLNNSGNTINFVSLFSLILAVGILVDSAIVITEGIYTKLREGYGKVDAAIEAIKELSWPVIAGTMTTVAVFAPLFFLSGITGQYIKSIPFTIIFLLVASLFVALAVVPLLATVFLNADNGATSRLKEKRDRLTIRLQEWYRGQLEKILPDQKSKRRLITGIVMMLLLSFGILAIPNGPIKVVFFGGEDSEYLFVDLELDQGATLLESNLNLRLAEEIVYAHPEVVSFVSTAGSGNAFSSGGSGARLANMTVILTEPNERSVSSGDISLELRSQLDDVLPNTTVRITELSSGPPTGAPISLRFFGDSIEDLNVGVQFAQDILESIEGTRDVESSLEDDGIDIVISPDREKIANAGLDVTTLSQSLRTGVYGATATTLRVGDDDIDVNVRLGLNPDIVDINQFVTTSVDELRQITIPTQNGTVLLGSLVDIELDKANAVIRREDLRRVASVSAEVTEDANAREIQLELESVLADAELPEGVEFDFGGGEAEENSQSFIEMGIALVAGIVLMLFIIILQFNSFRKAFTILAVIFFIPIGVVIGLAISRQPLSFPSMMGIIAVAGIAVNNSIILIDVMQRKRSETDNAEEAVIDGAVSRLRPILLTTLTTVIGMIPLTYASALWSPLAWAIIFGLSFTVVLTLLMVPIIETSDAMYGFFWRRFALIIIGLPLLLGGIGSLVNAQVVPGMIMLAISLIGGFIILRKDKRSRKSE